jgi:hypothetical protein
MSRIVFRPLSAWPDPETSPRKGSQFKASYDTTLRQLRDEADLLDAPEVVIQVVTANGELDLRVDGMLRAQARVVHVGCIVSMQTRHGPLRIATDAFMTAYYHQGPDWQANLRAITLGLEHLRTLDRYGITRRGEQYTGWKALPPGGIALRGRMTEAEALTYLREHSDVAALHNRPDLIREAYRQAARRLHPDQPGGSTEAFQRLEEAKRILEEADQ